MEYKMSFGNDIFIFLILFILPNEEQRPKIKMSFPKLVIKTLFHLIDLNEQSKNDNDNNPWILIFTEIQAKNPFYRASLMTEYWDPY